MAGYQHAGPNRNECHHHRPGPNIPSVKAPLIQPRHGGVLLERIPDQSGRIILTDPDPIRRMRVVAIGPDVYDLEVGDIVVLPGIAAEQPDHETGKQILAHMDDIGCKLE